ncbi:subtilase family protein [Tahibacter aquaticus]|uniref:Subtilase family protein n=1 Tax=Tahibacter aquaticus TaxID=520092 RepID=A0A4R6YHS0_9GAMM|nr:S8 family serine peptidase [Tahibacter aquaticus]TDR36324.1 subtilase family protein [Tahibacter aquaticus]
MPYRLPPSLCRSLLGLALATAALPALAASWARIEPSQAAAARAAGVAVVEDYGSFLWVRGDAQRLRALGITDAAEALDAFGLQLGATRFDPLASYPDSLQQIAAETAPRLHLLQFHGPVKQAWLDSLGAQGVTAVQYLAPDAYVVWGSGENLARAAAGSREVRWAGEFRREWRHNGVTATAKRGNVRVWLYRPAQVDEAHLRLAGAEVLDRAPIDASFDEVRARADAATLDNLLQIPGVYAVLPLKTSGGNRGEVGDAISMNMFGSGGVPQAGYRARLTQAGVDGSGVIMANIDTGIFENNPSLVARMLPCTGSSCGGSASSSHGTHTAAIMAGDGGAGTAVNGFQRGLGMAPGARLVEQVYSPTFTQAGGLLKLMTQSYANGAVLSGNSWGPSASPVGYDGDTRQVDVGARDTDPALAGDQPLIYVLSIMNGYGGTSSQGSPDEAKNVITVGSTWGETGPGVPDTARLNSLSTNSGHGPALDTRRIPHLVAPGCEIDSAINATGYGLDCGTSMASPHVAGAAGLFVQKYRNDNGGATPSPALVKAALLASAQDLFGGNDADGIALVHRPDNKQGWGRLRTDRLLAQDATVWYYDQQTVLGSTGEVWKRDLRPVDPTKPVQVMLVYTDAPGHGLGGSQAAWNNDLDLLVFSDRVRFRGNVFDAAGNSATGGTADPRNNVEAVMLTPEQVGATLRVQVTAANINSDALPNSGDGTEQDFAIVCRNCRVP